MELFLIIVVLVCIALCYAPFMFDTLQAMPFVFKIRNTIIFGVIGVIFSLQIDPFPIINVFAGMIAGSFVDYLVRDKQT
ncbi:hypothetical protein [Radiobacillus sp. PE A8.2]|uniref:hypothetical protein n=1 Tax=Radiobacillus sp. PE A8.2 TaxID=3380349 RepID=UPI00388DCA10